MFALHAAGPVNFEDVVKIQAWKEAMNEELNAIQMNNTWELVQLSKSKKVIGLKWVYKTKYLSSGEI